MNENYIQHDCVWVLFFVCNWPAIRPGLEGSTLKSMKGCPVRRGKNGQIWLAGKEAEPVTAARLYVSLCGGCFSLVVPTISVCLLFSAHGRVWKGRGEKKKEKPSESCTSSARKCEDISSRIAETVYVYINMICSVEKRRSLLQLFHVNS